MTLSDRVTALVYEAIDDFNQQWMRETPLPTAPDTVLLGPAGTLDSLGFVNLIVSTEARIEDAFGRPITLADERAMARERSPFRTVATLVDYVVTLLETP